MTLWTQSFARGLIYAVLICLPFQSIWLRIAENQGITGKPFFYLSDWYEILMLLFFFIVAAVYLVSLRKVTLTLTSIDILFLVLYLFALLTYFWSPHDFGYHIIGLRYSMLGIYIYFLTRLAMPNEEKLQQILSWVFWGVIGLGILQIALWVLLKDSLVLTLLGMEPVHKIVVIPQVFGSLPGPNQLGSFLVQGIIFAYFFTVLPKRNWLIWLSLILLILTFSRSAMVGLIGAVIIYSLYLPRKIFSVSAISTFVVLSLIIWLGLTVFYGGEVRDIFTHGASLQGHLNAIQNAIDRYLYDGTTWNLIFGYGAGEAGPATFVRPQSFIPESWYLQILYEYGLAGLLLILSAFCLTMNKAMKYKKHFIWVGLVAIVINSIFLHVFSDNPAVTALMFSGIALLASRPILTAKSES